MIHNYKVTFFKVEQFSNFFITSLNRNHGMVKLRNIAQHRYLQKNIIIIEKLYI